MINNQFYNDELILVDNKELQNRLSVLKEYSLSLNNYIYLLCNYNFIKIYDLVIESNIPDYLFITICKSKNPLNTIKRIKIYQSIEEKIETPSHSLRKELLSETKFLIPDDKLDNYLPNIVPNIVLEPINGNKITEIPSYLNELEKYKNNNVYVINGIRISRPKFLRNFEHKRHESSYFIASLISNSILNETEYYQLTNGIENKKLKNSLN